MRYTFWSVYATTLHGYKPPRLLIGFCEIVQQQLHECRQAEQLLLVVAFCNIAFMCSTNLTIPTIISTYTRDLRSIDPCTHLKPKLSSTLACLLGYTFHKTSHVKLKDDAVSSLSKGAISASKQLA